MVAKKTSNCSWLDALNQILLETRKPTQRIAVVGIGNELRGDDAAGIAVVDALQHYQNDHSLVIRAGTAPENFTGTLLRFAPDLVLLIDALQMNDAPGEIFLLDPGDAENCSVTTHSLSCHMLSLYLQRELLCTVKLLGIQVEQDALATSLSPSVRRRVRSVITALAPLLA